MIEVSRFTERLTPYGWSLIEPWISEALDVAGAWTSGDYREWLEAGQKHLWLVSEDETFIACACTEIHDLPKTKILNIDLIAGERMETWLTQLFDAVEEFARAQSCTQVMSNYARRGWIKALAPQGWTPRAVIIAKDLP